MKHLALLIAVAVIATAADKPQVREGKSFRLQWADLDRLAHGNRADLVLPNGIELGGTVLAVESDALVLDLKKTSDKREWPKGRASIPRAQVSHLRITRIKSTWRAVGTGIGVGIGVLAAAAVIASVPDADEAKAAGAACLMVGLPAAAGYGLGWGPDHKTTEIDIERGPAKAESLPMPDPSAVAAGR